MCLLMTTLDIASSWHCHSDPFWHDTMTYCPLELTAGWGAFMMLQSGFALLQIPQYLFRCSEEKVP